MKFFSVPLVSDKHGSSLSSLPSQCIVPTESIVVIDTQLVTTHSIYSTLGNNNGTMATGRWERPMGTASEGTVVQGGTHFTSPVGKHLKSG